MITLNSTVAKVLRDNEVNFCGLTYKVSDDEAKKLQKFIEDMLNGKSTKVNAPTVVEEETTSSNEKYPSVEPKVADEKKFLASGLVSMYYDDKKYKAFFNYSSISRMAYDKNKKERDESKYEYLKKMFKDEIKSYGAKWVSYNAEDESDPRGWYQFPKKSDAEEYRKARLAKDKEYEKKRKA